MFKEIQNSDEIVLESVESYLKKNGAPNFRDDQEKLVATAQARDYLYSAIVPRVPRIAACIMESRMLENDIRVQGLNEALSKHVLDPAFVSILMQYLAQANDPEQNAVTGALLTKIMSKYMDTKLKGKKKDEQQSFEEIAHIRKAIQTLLNDIASIVAVRCGGLTELESFAIASCIAMNNEDTLSEILNSNLAITANIFDVLRDPSNIIRAALLLEKSKWTKLSTNQNSFIESLKKWVYDKLNVLPMVTCRQLLISFYGTTTPDVSKYLINLKDCGTAYSNLLIVSKQMFN